MSRPVITSENKSRKIVRKGSYTTISIFQDVLLLIKMLNLKEFLHYFLSKFAKLHHDHKSDLYIL